MNKVININISGMVFYIDEEAFDVLDKYLSSLRRHFKSEEGGDEILADIEGRIAEMLNERLKNRNEVVSMADVQAVIAAMGQPEDMGETETKTWSKNFNWDFKAGKRLFRDPDNRWFGGVCGGIGAYFDIDPLIIRVLFIVLAFLFGTSILIYLILWAVLPAAYTASEKLEMRGQRINISSIEKTVKENLDTIKDRLDKEFKHFESKDFRDKAHNFFEGVGEGMAGAARPVFYIISRLFSMFIVFVSMAALISIILGALGVLGFVTIAVPSFIYDFFDTSQQAALVTLLFFLVVALPFVGMLFGALRRLSGYRRRNRFFSAFFSTVWVLAFIALAVLAFGSVTRFSRKYDYEMTDQLKRPAHDTLYVAVNDNGTGLTHYHGEGDTEVGYFWERIKTSGDNSDMGRVTLDISRSDDKTLKLEKAFYSRGKTVEDAHNLAQSVIYNYAQNDSALIFDIGYRKPKGQPWRGQNVKLNLLVPQGMVVVLKHGTDEILYDIENTTDTYDGDMPGHKWQMGPEVLQCLDCDTARTNRSHRHRHWKWRGHINWD